MWIMGKQKTLTDKQKNNFKLDAFPNLYSIVTFWASVLMLIASIIIDDATVYKISITIIFVISFVAYCFIERSIKKRIAANHKTEALRNCITKHARFAGYFGYVVLFLTVLFS